MSTSTRYSTYYLAILYPHPQKIVINMQGSGKNVQPDRVKHLDQLHLLMENLQKSINEKINKPENKMSFGQN